MNNDKFDPLSIFFKNPPKVDGDFLGTIRGCVETYPALKKQTPVTVAAPASEEIWLRDFAKAAERHEELVRAMAPIFDAVAFHNGLEIRLKNTTNRVDRAEIEHLLRETAKLLLSAEPEIRKFLRAHDLFWRATAAFGIWVANQLDDADRRRDKLAELGVRVTIAEHASGIPADA